MKHEEKWKVFIISLIIACFFFGSDCYALSAKARYDIYFKIYAKRFFSYAVDWRWFKAQGIAESNLNPNAVSPVGAIGIMQLMPFTSKEVAQQLGIKNMPRDPKLNIMMGIYYDYRMFKVWKKCSILIERLRFMFASYNAGLGHIIKANRKAPSHIKYKWEAIENFLPAVTGRHSKETIAYVKRIEKIYAEIMESGINVMARRISFIVTVSSIINAWISKLFGKKC